MVTSRWLAFKLSVWAGALCAFHCSSESYADTKYVRLRQGTIATAPASPSAGVRLQGLGERLSGLYLIQFEERFRPAWRGRLQAAGAKLLRYVPDDAFVARLSQAQLSQIRALPYVRWVGEYRPEYKLDDRLPLAVGPAKPAAVRLLLAPDTTEQEKQAIDRRLSGMKLANYRRFGGIMSAEANARQVGELARLAAVLWIEPAGKPKLLDEIAAKIVGGPDSTNGHQTATQQLGFGGQGIVVAVADSGLNSGTATNMHPDLVGRVDQFFYYGALTNAADEHGHGTHVAGIIAGSGATGETDSNGALFGLGVAPGTHLLAQRIFDAQGNLQAPSNNEVLTHDAVRAGALIGCHSWGDDTQGRYDLNAADFDGLVRDADAGRPGDQPYVLVFAAGNAGPGPQTIDSPAVGKNVIATGASQNGRTDQLTYTDGPDAMADFSSRGPCEDGRIKPDLVAPGTWIASLRSASASDQYAWLPISANYQYQGGTSQAAPHLAGAAAVFVQYYRQTHANATPSPALVKAALINGAVALGQTNSQAAVPNHTEGWGRVDLSQLIGSARRYDYLDQTVLLSTGQTYERPMVVAGGAEPLKVTLVYTDVPGLPAAIPALVNDLDLEVIGPDGRLYRGNQFENGESVPDAPTADNLNNVEGVFLRQPVAGQYLVRVRARNVVEDARLDTAPIDQDFALVISGDLPPPGVGVISLDRTAYAAPATIQIRLIDTDLAGQAAARVLVRSTTQTNGLVVALQPLGIVGVFTGSVRTSAGPLANDGRLHLSQGDLIEVIYADNSPPGLRVATAKADTVPPVITGVAVTNQFGLTILSWHTDEPATSLVRYGPGSILNYAVTNSALTQDHQVTLDNLKAGSTNAFLVISADAAGNTATNDNHGLLFQLVVRPSALVLLVDAYQSDGVTADIPASSYTDALAQSRVSFDVWSVAQMGRYPGTNDLRPYRVVLWRINDSIYSLSSIDPPQQATLAAYLSGRGSLLLASMEILSRIGNVPFRTNVLQVQAFNEDVGVPAIVGLNSDPISSGISLTLDFSAFPRVDALNLGPDFSDTVTPTTNAAPVFYKGSTRQVAGLRYPRIGQDSAGRLIFLGFPLEAVPATGEAPNNRANLLRNCLSFLAPGAYGAGTVALDSQTYTVPARVTVEVADANLSGQGQTAVKFFSGFETNGRPVALDETVRRGLFRGFIALVPATNAPAPGQLRTVDGDQIWAEYYDLAATNLVRAVASVDTVAPVLAAVLATPQYETAEIDWTTSKAADSLVQFGESTFLGRTAYSPTLAMNHALSLGGLMPDRSYYFQVVSRDAAGNTAVEDNQGHLYTLHTLKPLSVPWSDPLPNGDTNWVAIQSSQGGALWQLGVPQNGVQAAPGVTNAWGSNLSGSPIDFADTTLLGPAISLPSGSLATLHFWQSYDFTISSESVLYEAGQVNISTDNGSTWQTLAQYHDASAGWERADLDLTPYAGKIIRLGWYYGFYAFSPMPRPGWLVGAVSVTVTNLAHGTIWITNNLSQAHFTITGPLSQSGEGWSYGLSNAPLGTYVVTFKPVPFYQTPPPQTNNLVATKFLLFQGRYTFVDTNNNDLPDSWEQAYFGVVAPFHPGSVDTDGDGSSDYAEFIAGTNPTNALSYLHLDWPQLLADGTTRFTWGSVPGRAYRLQTSTNGLAWSGATDWLRAGGTRTSLVLPTRTNNCCNFYRLEVRP